MAAAKEEDEMVTPILIPEIILIIFVEQILANPTNLLTLGLIIPYAQFTH